MMSAIVWVCAATALWHFTILIPDRFYGGLIGALMAANGGACIAGALILGWPPAQQQWIDRPLAWAWRCCLRTGGIPCRWTALRPG
jgi:hypothetical protein